MKATFLGVQQSKLISASVAAAIIATSVAFAVDTQLVNSFDNATIQPTGPRTGTNGKRFFNVEGDNYANFSSYGVVDFNLSGAGVEAGEVGSIQSITLNLFQANSSFTMDGAVGFYLTMDTTASIQPGSSSLTYIAPSADNNDGVGTNLNPMFQLGSGTFTEVASGTMDVYQFSLVDLELEAQAYLVNQLNTGGTLRVVIVPEDTTVTATWGGGDNFNGVPQVQFSYMAVPEPGTLALIAISGILFFGAMRGRLILRAHQSNTERT